MIDIIVYMMYQSPSKSSNRTKLLLKSYFCGFWSNRILLYFPLFPVRVSQAWHHIISLVYDDFDQTNHTFSESPTLWSVVSHPPPPPRHLVWSGLFFKLEDSSQFFNLDFSHSWRNTLISYLISVGGALLRLLLSLLRYLHHDVRLLLWLLQAVSDLHLT